MDRPASVFASALSQRVPGCRMLSLGIGGWRRVPEDAQA
jgi:hypothetical protein